MDCLIMVIFVMVECEMIEEEMKERQEARLLLCLLWLSKAGEIYQMICPLRLGEEGHDAGVKKLMTE